MKAAYVCLLDISDHVEKLNCRMQEILDTIKNDYSGNPRLRPDLVVEYNKLCRIVDTFNNACDDLGL